MEVTLSIPDDIAGQLLANGADLNRRALEGLALEELRAARITEAQAGKLLGLERSAMDAFLKARGIYHDFTVADIERQAETLKHLGF